MDIDSLNVFRAVAQQGSVSKAAATLCCVPSNVTARIRSLEGELGVKLFVRQPRGMALTPSGATLLEYACRAASLLTEAKAAMAGGGEPAGPLCVGSTESVAANRLPDVLIDFAGAFPEVELSLRVANSEELSAMVLENEVEGAFISKKAYGPKLAGTAVFEEELCLVTARGASLMPDTLSKVVVQRKGCAYREALERFLEREGVAVTRKIEMPTPEVALACVAAGMGVAVMPRSALARLDAAGSVSVHALPEELRAASVSLVWRKDFPLTPAFESFRRWCLEKRARSTPFSIRS